MNTDDKEVKVPENEDIEILPCSFKFHEFSAQIGEVRIRCHIMKMEDSLYLWVGDPNDPVMSDLSLALISKYDSVPIATKILGGMTDSTSSNIAKRLAKKLGKVVYVSFNIPVNNCTLPGIEKRIYEEFVTHAELLSF